MQSGRSATIRLLRVAMIASLLFPTLLFSYASWVSYRATNDAADERIERSLDVLHEQALKVFQSIELALDNVNEALRGRSDADIIADEPNLRERFTRIVDELSEVQSIWVFDRDGHALVSTYGDPPSRSFADRDYFHVQATRDAGTYVGELLISRVNGKPFFGVSRRRLSPDGGFVGVVEVSIVPTDFYRFYARIVRSAGLRFALVRDDGAFLARYPNTLDLPVRLTEQSDFHREIARHPQGGLYTNVSQIDGIERRVGIARLEGFPIYVNAAIETSSIRAEWIASMAPHLIFGIPATLLLFATIGVVLKRTRRLYAEVDRREAAEDALRQSQKMEAVGQLTGGVAHDFNNLLTVILGNLDIAQRTLDTWTEGAADKLRRVVNNARQGADRAVKLTQSLLAFSRRQPLDPKPLDVNRLIVGLSDFLRRSLGEMISLETVGSGGLWKVEIDPGELEAALVNLAVNARDAMPGGGKLTIETSNAFLDEEYCALNSELRVGQYVLIAVSDNGAGMRRDVLERAFEPFFTTKIAGQGTGLGLSRVYGFVRQSGGHLKIYSEPGEGTTVKIYLPRWVGELRDEPPAPLEAPGGHFGETILVVEDDEDVRDYVVESLRELKYQVLEAADAEAAVKIVDRHAEPIDLLLTDIVLPGRNGRKLADDLQLRQRGLKVLFMTGYSRNAIVHHGRLDAGVELIQKPLTQAALAAKVRALLDASVIWA